MKSIDIVAVRPALACLGMLGALFLAAPLPALAADHPYFDELASMPQAILVRSYRDQATIELDRNQSGGAYERSDLLYDAQKDGVRFVFSSNNANPRSALRPDFDGAGSVASGNLFYTWESYWDGRWADPANRGPMVTHKTFQLGNLESATDQRRIEIRTHYGDSSSIIGENDFRRYRWSASGPDQPLPGQQNRFAIKTETWTRYFAFVDFDRRQLSVWVADEDRQPVVLMDQFQFTSMDPGSGLAHGLNSFWFQYNSSQDRTGPELYTWARNLVVLRNVSNPESLVQLGSDVGGGVPVTRPMPPVLDQADQ
jgi:hypothetical protein